MSVNINLDNYESIFDALADLRWKEREYRHTISDVIDFPITGDEFKVKDLKSRTECLSTGGIDYLIVSRDSKDKNRVVKIDKYSDTLVRYTNVSLDVNGVEIEDTYNKMYEFDITKEPDYFNMYIELLYEIKHYN